MGTYTATIRWERAGAVFTDNAYSRRHTWGFDGGVEVPASASPLIVPPPRSAPDAVDPEEAFVASLASCHMLFFVDLARRAGWVLDRYDDEASGVLGKTAEGRMAMTHVTLRPAVVYAGPEPTIEEEMALHHQAHELCFIANSVTTRVEVEAPPRGSAPAGDPPRA